jgi:hypothetical protein
MYIIAAPRDKRQKEQKMVGQIARDDKHGGRPKLSPMDWGRRPALYIYNGKLVPLDPCVPVRPTTMSQGPEA